MSLKRVFCLYDHKSVPRYIGATIHGETEAVVSDMICHYRTALAEINNGKVPNRREILLRALIKLDHWDLRFVSEPRLDWAKAKEAIIKGLKAKGIVLANETTGGVGATGNKLSPLSMAKRQKSQDMMDNATAYQMHVLHRDKGWTQKAVAEKFGLTEKGVQKIISGERRAEAYCKWLNNIPKPPFDPKEDVDF